MFQKLKQFKDLRDEAKQVQNALSKVTVHGKAAGGNVAVVMDGNQKIMALDIDTSLLAPEHKEKVEKGVKDAIEDALKELQKVMLQKMRSGEMEMPDMSALTK